MGFVRSRLRLSRSPHRSCRHPPTVEPFGATGSRRPSWQRRPARRRKGAVGEHRHNRRLDADAERREGTDKPALDAAPMPPGSGSVFGDPADEVGHHDHALVR